MNTCTEGEKEQIAITLHWHHTPCLTHTIGVERNNKYKYWLNKQSLNNRGLEIFRRAVWGPPLETDIRAMKRKKRREGGSNTWPYDLQSYALPTELSWLLNVLFFCSLSLTRWEISKHPPIYNGSGKGSGNGWKGLLLPASVVVSVFATWRRLDTKELYKITVGEETPGGACLHRVRRSS